MPDKGRSVFFDWVIYALGVLSVVAMIYLFIGRYGTEIVISQKPKNDSKVQVSVQKEDIPVSLPQKVETPSSSLLETKDSSTIRKSSVSRPAQISPKKGNKPKRNSSIKNKSNRIAKNSYRSQNKGSKNRICVPSEPSKANYRKIRGFELFPRPIRVPQKEYNWKVLNRYPLQAKKNLKKIGAYRVQRGDTVYSIARQFGVRAIDIMAINRQVKNPDKLEVRSKILIPGF